jgi:hypothetical protein
MSAIANLIGEDGLKFDTNVELGRDTLWSMFGVVLGAIICGIVLQAIVKTLIKK